MTTIHPDEVSTVETRSGFWTRTRIAGAVYAVLGATAAAAIFGTLAPGETVRFVLSENADGASLDIDGTVGTILFGVLALASGAALIAGVASRWGRLALHGVAIVSLLMSFLCWQLAASTTSHFMPVVDMLDGTLSFALPLILGGVAGLLCERSGVINVAMEGQFIVGAFFAAMFTTIAASVWVGLIAAAIGGLLIAAVLAVLSIRYLVNQVVLGVILVAFGLGLTGFLYVRMMAASGGQEKYNTPSALPVWEVPGLSKIPVLGPVLFKSNILVYITLLVVGLVYFGLFYTRWGLRVRAVGEHPTAADTLGVRVLLVRYRNVLLGGIVAGIGGAYFVLNDGNQFQKGMSAGLGFISLAAVIVGRWNPIGVLLASLFFGFAQKLSFYLQVIQSPIPSQFLAMIPYLVTIVAVAGLVGRVRAPAADGLPYVKG